MKIAVGSKNKAKVEAVQEILRDYSHLADAEVVGIEVASEIADQPKSLEETITGAMNRARNAFDGVEYAVGIESGLMQVPHSKSGYMDVCVAAIYDGTDHYLGLSSAWEFPNPEVMRMIVEGDTNMSEVINRVGLTSDANIGANEGAIGIVTKGRLARKAFTKEALRSALIHIDIHE
jgi:inosine/xanthosine triphosphatase